MERALRTRGRQLSKMTLKDNSEITYRYNQDGLRTYKETNTTSTDYEWDETKLIRETVTYKATGKNMTSGTSITEMTK